MIGASLQFYIPQNTNLKTSQCIGQLLFHMKDLFQHIDTLPKEVQHICHKMENVEYLNYSDCKYYLQELVQLGYRFYYGLDAIPYHLHHINTYRMNNRRKHKSEKFRV